MTKVKNQVQKNDLFSFKKRATKHGWAVSSSSDGYSVFDGYTSPDGYADALTSDGYGLGGFSNPKAWFVMSKLVNTKHYSFCIQTDGYQGYRVKVSSLSSFTLGNPGLLVTPSSSHETILLGSGTDASPVYQKILSFNGAVNERILNISFKLTDKIMNFMLIDRAPLVQTTLPTVSRLL